MIYTYWFWFWSQLTPRFSALIRMGSFLSEGAKIAHASAVISALGLNKVRHSIVGDETSRGLSGGERKRLNIGIELAAAPLLLLLDEPTSGLDSSAALELCQVLPRGCVFSRCLHFATGSKNSRATAAHNRGCHTPAPLGDLSSV
jgi:ABC-type dipeptide/oligopeptide/nickel transport system ATPase component